MYKRQTLTCGTGGQATSTPAAWSYFAKRTTAEWTSPAPFQAATAATSTRTNRKRSPRKPCSRRPMELVYTDLGPIKRAAKGGNVYVSKFTDDVTRMNKIFLLKSKDQAVESLSLYSRPSRLGSVSNASGQTRKRSTPQVFQRVLQRRRHGLEVRSDRDSTCLLYTSPSPRD